ncbi:hypothetical protein TNCV_2493501 [Trichonephila clavipes]|uniref:Uncharacterized protein n=1 Tax=Trichonephila clavipes TaxID=2585209 RepID=A0A8X6RUS6_TRICX|nr:hypothetical protein TNCV_2493501 [Trichonephila clavipes]
MNSLPIAVIKNLALLSHSSQNSSMGHLQVSMTTKRSLPKAKLSDWLHLCYVVLSRAADTLNIALQCTCELI